MDCRPCFNCGIFGHKGKKCKNDTKCIKCTEAHQASECKAEYRKCSNCVYSNNKYKTKCAINHEATDYGRCEVFQTRIRKYIDSMDYIIKPVISRYIGNVNNYINIQRSAGLSGISAGTSNSLNDKTTDMPARNLISSNDNITQQTNT